MLLRLLLNSPPRLAIDTEDAEFNFWIELFSKTV